MNYNSKSVKNFAIASCLVLSVVSCRKDEPNTNLNSLQKVEYEVKPEQEISAVPTGVTAVDPNTGVVKKEYLVTTERSYIFEKPFLTTNYGIDKNVLFPGSILKGSSFMNGIYEPLFLSNNLKPITFYLDLKGTEEVKKENVIPDKSGISDAFTYLKIANENVLPTDYVPTNYTFESVEVNNVDSFKQMGLHVKTSYQDLTSAYFDYYNTSSSNKYVMVKLKHSIFSAHIDPGYQSNWIDGSINASECGTHEPVYISNVDYGRVAYILIETNEDTEEVRKMVKAVVDLKVGNMGGAINENYNNKMLSLFAANKVKIYVSGGPTDIVNSYDRFINHVKLPNNSSLVFMTSVPISYTVRRIKDNTQVEFVNYYKDVRKEFR